MNHRHAYSFISTTFALFLTGLISSNAYASETLLDIYALAQTNDHELRSAAAKFRADSEAAAISRAGVRPTITGSATLSRTNTDTNGTTASETDTDTLGYSVALEQPLIDFSAWTTYQQAKVQTNIAAASYEASKQSLILRTAQSYFDTLRAVDQLQTDRAEEKAQETLLEQTRQRYEVGLISINGVHEAQAAYDNAVANRINSEANVGIRYDAISILTSQLHNNIAPLRKDFTATPPDPAQKQSWVDFALRNNLNLKVAEMNAQASLLAAKAAKDDHKPTLSGTISYGVQDNDIDTAGATATERDTNSTVFSLNLSVPLYSGGGLSALERQASQRAIQSREDFLFAQRSTIQNTRSLYLSVTTDIAQLNARLQAIVSNESALEATKAGYDAGTRDIVDMVNAQSNLFQARRNYLDTLYNYIINTLRLKQAAGNLQLADLEALEQSLLQ